MRVLKITIAISVVGIAIFIVYFSLKQNKSNEQTPLSIKEREFIDFDLQKISNFEVVGKIIRIWRNDKYIWLSDANSSQVLEYEHTGKFKRTYGKAGGAPWENGSIWYFNKSNDEYYDYDYSKNSIRKYSILEDSLLYSYKPESQIGNTIQYKNDLFLISEFEKTVSRFSLIDIKTKETVQEFLIEDLVTNEFGEFPKTNRNLVFEGEYKSNGNSLVFTCSKFSCFFHLSSEGELRLGRTIDGFNLPRAKNVDIGNGYTMIGIEPDNLVNYASTLTENKILILSNVVKESQSKQRIIDIYNIETLKYENSIILPNYLDQRPIDLSYSNKELAILYENYSVVNYAF
ncbi:hypothetical protein [Roseivirga seohaensis]|uniref:hypothetical protein n=1 Tax=Roseivirga seohaensis TaxID=1914963 RepID=UPI003BA8537B